MGAPPDRSVADAKAMFERDNEVRRIEDPNFEGSVWDREWEDLQPYCQNLYLMTGRTFDAGNGTSEIKFLDHMAHLSEQERLRREGTS